MEIEITPNLLEQWNRCPFCGASRGMYGFPLAQHTPRCRYKGDANSNDVSVPNYNQMIEEHDAMYLPMMQSHHVLPSVRAKLAKVETKLAALYEKYPEEKEKEKKSNENDR